MDSKPGRNDPCPCGSGKKYKQCCMNKERPRVGPKKFTAKILSTPKTINLIERAYTQPIPTSVEPEKTVEEPKREQKEQP